MKNKLLSLIAAMLCAICTMQVFSQDLIILRSGDEIQALVSEIGLDQIKYRKYENPNGPLYTLEKSKVFMIKYANGSKDVFSQEVVQPGTNQQSQGVPSQSEAKVEAEAIFPAPLQYRFGIRKDGSSLSDAEIRAILANYPEPLNYYTQGYGLQVAGSVLQWSVIGVLIYTAIKAKPLDPPESEEVAKKGLIVGGSLVVGWLTLSNIGSLKQRKAVDTYNAAIAKPAAYNIDLILNDAGVGLALRF